MTSTVTTPASTIGTEEETETDSPLDNANFLSFEEWKKQNLAKAGQSPEHVGQQRSSGNKQGRQRPGINNALDVLGEDTEIELDFSGFGGGSRSEEGGEGQKRTNEANPSASGRARTEISLDQVVRSKDAGKTCKERTNYASFDCAATVLKTNPECKSASSVLIENKDSYMLNPCGVSNKFLIVELCNDILIDTVVLANYEFFSSIFRTFRVSVSDRYPVKPDRWKELGVFEARNSRGVQAFLIEHSLIWARYLRVEFLTHYGSEYYCPVSLLRVHGTTMMEEFRHEEQISRGEDSDEPEIEEVDAAVVGTVEQEPPESSEAADEAAIAANPAERSVVNSATSLVIDKPSHGASVAKDASSHETSSTRIVETPSLDLDKKKENINTPVMPSQLSGEGVNNTSQSKITVDSPTVYVQPSSTELAKLPNSDAGNANKVSPPPSTSQSKSAMSDTSIHDASQTSSALASSAGTASSIPTLDASQPVHGQSQGTAQSNTTKGISSSQESGRPQHTSSKSVQSSSKAAQGSSKSSSASSEPSRQGTSTQPAPQANPTTQESFFKSIHKRLQMLESNATLSLQYIEEQSRILRDAFSKVEKRQILKAETFLKNLNSTVVTELEGFRQQYDQLWQSTIIELENHREQYQREMFALSSRLTFLADELVFQKRMAIVQSTLLMMCLVFLLFGRSGNSALELPLLQQIVNRSQSAVRSPYYSPPTSPSPDHGSPARFRRRSGFWHSSATDGNASDDVSYDDASAGRQRPSLQFEPPTPTSPDEAESEGDELQDAADAVAQGGTGGDGVAEPDKAHALPKGTQSSPATPSGTREEGVKIAPAWPGEVVRPQSPLAIR